MEMIEQPLPVLKRTSTDFLQVLLPHREDAGAILCLVLFQAGVMHVRIKVSQKATMPPPTPPPAFAVNQRLGEAQMS